MKYLVYLTIVFCAIALSQQGLTPEMRKDMETKLTAECSKLESDVTPEDLKNVADRVIPTNRSGKCLHACLIENLGITRNFKVDVDSAKSLAKYALDDDQHKLDIALAVLDQCADIHDDDRCETAIKLIQCGIKEANARGLNFREII